MKQDRNLHVRIDYFPWRPEAYQLQADEIFDLIACGETIEIGKERFPAVLTQYAEEYKKTMTPIARTPGAGIICRIWSGFGRLELPGSIR